ncbi:MAG TPA: AraC family transcriptional regulator [Gemmatimonas sp.]|uniref:helix-turn-helix transcriptional regulator n=1 Tax=Gemmatimonas sp. TaxID=1962908 RepID=UPI002ED9019B
MPPLLHLFIDDYRAAARQAAHEHDSLHFSVVLRGGLTETVGRTTEHAGPLSVVVKDAGVRHANAWGADGARLARLSLPKGTMDALVDDPARAVAWRWTREPLVARPFLRLIERRQRGTQAFAADDGDLLDLVAAFTARRTHEPQGAPPVWLSETIDRLRDEWRPELTGAALAHSAHVHPVYLARCVRRWYGRGLGDLLRHERLRHAMHAVANSPTRLSLVAQDCGYADEAHLCRDVRRALGATPGRYRRLLETAGPRTTV